MGRSKQTNNKGSSATDGKYRKETKEERRVRLQDQVEAREKCFKLLPLAGGAFLVLLIIFATYVRSVPPKEVVEVKQPQFQGGMPDFGNVDTEPMVKEALDEAEEVLKNLKKERAKAEGGAASARETIEL